MHFDFDLEGDVKEVSRLFYRTAGNYVSRGTMCAAYIEFKVGSLGSLFNSQRI